MVPKQEKNWTPTLEFPKNTKLKWVDNTTIAAGDTTLILPRGFEIRESSKGEIFLFKDRNHIETYLTELAHLSPKRIFEIGVWDGGSAVFFWNLFRPDKLCCIDLANEAPFLSSYIEGEGLYDSLRFYAGVDQSDRDKIFDILRLEFEDSLDFVVDDGCHLYAPSLATFEAVFPHVTPGGWYVIEDWKSNVLFPSLGGGPDVDNPPFHRLIQDLLKIATFHQEVVRSIRVFHNFVMVERGNARLAQKAFVVAEYLR